MASHSYIHRDDIRDYHSKGVYDINLPGVFKPASRLVSRKRKILDAALINCNNREDNWQYKNRM